MDNSGRLWHGASLKSFPQKSDRGLSLLESENSCDFCDSVIDRVSCSRLGLTVVLSQMVFELYTIIFQPQRRLTRPTSSVAVAELLVGYWMNVLAPAEL